MQRVQVKIAIPFVGEISGDWEPDTTERNAAWELYVELITRVAVVELREGEGSLREAMSSMYSLFSTTRDILRRFGPGIAPASKEGKITFGALAVTVLNGSLRPFLTIWHPRLLEWEASRPAGRSAIEHERDWPSAPEMHRELGQVRLVLAETARILGKVAGAADLIAAPIPAQRESHSTAGLDAHTPESS